VLPYARRHLDWEGCFNVRDLGGLKAGGGATRWGAVVRADALDGLTAAGWAALWQHGVRTVIDLREPGERGVDAAPRPRDVTTVHLPLDGREHREFWDEWASGPQFGTPLYYRAHLARFPERSAAVVAAIARAAPGGVVVHCAGGRDRSGLIALLVLALAGVDAPAIAADYELSGARLRARCEALGEPDPGPELEAFLAERGTTAGDVIAATLAALDVEACLRGGGMTRSDAAALRARMLAPGVRGGR
jgi:protein-tyrosine phosphatase